LNSAARVLLFPAHGGAPALRALRGVYNRRVGASRKLRLAEKRLRLAGPLLLATLALGGCQKFASRTDMAPLDQAGMWVNSVEQLRQIKVTDAEVQQLALARQAGLSDQSCVELIRIAHGRNQTFADGQDVAGLVGAGFGENSVLALAHLNQLGPWSGEAEVMKLANLSDDVILTVATRRAAGEPVLSSAKIADLRNAGFTDKEIIADIQSGTTDAQADDIIYRKNYLAGGHSFVHQQGRRRH
jgi:hypothetical protein